ncbi:WecB/TagA/CpsF family glycosyltransferase [Candidatus Peregrinibacteria bacterium]|nr:WecB/TagA/CpsF family glycosyltransferase [Candidatus Peregrinibacteria bacterium]
MKTHRIELFGIPFDVVNTHHALLKLHYYSQVSLGEQYFCVTPNPEMIVYASKHPAFFRILKDADFSLPDGTGILWASGFLPPLELQKLSSSRRKKMWKIFLDGVRSLWQFTFDRKNFRGRIFARITGTDMFGDFLATSQAKIFLLGGAPLSAKTLAENFPNIVGYYDGKVTSEKSAAILEHIKNSDARVLFVALGSPKQEMWISEHLSKIPNIRFAMGVGGAFDFIAGKRKRAPFWMQRAGLEWLFRLLREPKRIVRIFRATVSFFFLALRERQKLL